MGTRERQILPVGRAAGGGPGATPRGLLNRPGAGTAESRGEPPGDAEREEAAGGRAERAAEAGREWGWRDRPTGWDRKRGEKPAPTKLCQVLSVHPLPVLSAMMQEEEVRDAEDY